MRTQAPTRWTKDGVLVRVSMALSRLSLFQVLEARSGGFRPAFLCLAGTQVLTTLSQPTAEARNSGNISATELALGNVQGRKEDGLIVGGVGNLVGCLGCRRFAKRMLLTKARNDRRVGRSTRGTASSGRYSKQLAGDGRACAEC